MIFFERKCFREYPRASIIPFDPLSRANSVILVEPLREVGREEGRANVEQRSSERYQTDSSHDTTGTGGLGGDYRHLFILTAATPDLFLEKKKRSI